MENEKKPAFKPDKGQQYMVKLDSTQFFSSGSNEYNGVAKKWYGYNLTHDSKEYVYFASESVNDLIVASGIQSKEEFSLELRSVKNSEGQLRSMWYLNGKNKWEYEDGAQPSAPLKSPSQPTQSEASGINSMTNTLDSIIKRIEALESKVNKDDSQVVAKVSDDDIPF